MTGGHVIERVDPFDGALGFSLVVRAGSTVYTAGCFGIDPATLEISDDLDQEMRQTFDNLEATLAMAGATLADVVDMTTFIGGDHSVVYPAFQKVRTERMAGRPPASATVIVAGFLDPKMHVELKATAVIQEP